MSGGPFPSGTVTFLFSDIEESTGLIRLLGDGGYAAIRAHHHRLLREAFQAHGGHEIDTSGDGFFVAFHSAREAVAAALAGQRALAGFDWPAIDRPALDRPAFDEPAFDEPGVVEVRVRMGLHTAEPHLDATGYAGMGVHRAARICNAAHGGQILMSHATAGIVEDAQLPGVVLVDVGEHRLKGLARKQRMFQLTAPGLPSRFDGPRTAEAGARIPGVGTFLATDLRGWQRFIREHGDEAGARVVADYHRSVSALVDTHGGITLEQVADNALAVFHSAGDAVRAAAAIRAALGVGVSVGVHAGRWSGDPDRPAAGTALVRLMRQLQVAEPGQVLVSQTTAALIEGDSDAPALRDLGSRAIPELELDEAVRLYELAP